MNQGTCYAIQASSYITARPQGDIGNEESVVAVLYDWDKETEIPKRCWLQDIKYDIP